MDDISLTIKALAFAAHKHRHQRREDVAATPYINHPIALADILANEGGVTDVEVICAALLHDTIEDTDTSPAELQQVFGTAITSIVLDVTDDMTATKTERKRLQIEHTAHASHKAKLVKLADKISNLRDIANSPPEGWSLQRKQKYFDWAKQVVDQVRGAHTGLEIIFNAAYAIRPK